MEGAGRDRGGVWAGGRGAREGRVEIDSVGRGLGQGQGVPQEGEGWEVGWGKGR